MTNEELKTELCNAIWKADADHEREDAEPFPERIMKGMAKTLEAHGYAIVPAEPTEEMVHQATLTVHRENKGLEYAPYQMMKALIKAGKVTIK